MTNAKEAAGANTAMGSDLLAGLQTLSLDQEITFRLYVRVVLPIDGFVFWVRADQVSNPAIATAIVSVAQLSDDQMKGLTFTAMGSLHFAQDVRQEEQENYTANRMVFTTEEEINELNSVAPNTMWIGEFVEGMRFAFSTNSSRYQQADLWHYSGFAVYPDMEPQIIDDAQTQFSIAQVVSNSVPFWLDLATYNPLWAFWQRPPILFPSFLPPLNEAPPFGTVHVFPESTVSLASAPTIDPLTSTHTQLCTERVRVTLWGCRNTAALDFIDAVNQYTLDTGNFGIMNIPTVRDEKRTQSEMGILAQKKTIEYEISYLQHRVNTIAQKVISHALPNVSIEG